MTSLSIDAPFRHNRGGVDTQTPCRCPGDAARPASMSAPRLPNSVSQLAADLAPPPSISVHPAAFCEGEPPAGPVLHAVGVRSSHHL
ncbi:hypothetical protein [Azospirillum doebereinerae]